METSQKQPDRVEAFAKEIQGHLQDASYEQIKDADDLNFETIQEWVSKLKSTLDTEFGGYKFVFKVSIAKSSCVFYWTMVVKSRTK